MITHITGEIRLRVVLGPFSCNPIKDQSIIDAFENLPEGTSKSGLFRLAMHHYLETGDNGTDHTLESVDDKLSQVIALLKSGVAVAVRDEDKEIVDDPRLAQAQAALDRLGES